MSKQKTHVSMFKSVPAGGWYSITEARVLIWSEQHARGKPTKSDQQQTIIQVSHWNLLCHRYRLLLVRKRGPFVCDTLIFESRCRAHHVEEAPPISNVSTFPHTIPVKFDTVETTRVWQQHCRLCQPSHTTSLHMLLFVTAISVPGGSSSPSNLVCRTFTSSIWSHKQPSSSQHLNDPDMQLLLPLMKLETFVNTVSFEVTAPS